MEKTIEQRIEKIKECIVLKEAIDRISEQTQKKIFLPFFVFWVGQHCSLTCKDCCNLIPYGHQKVYNVEDSLNALYALLRVADINHLQIQGGEPLLHPELHVFLEAISALPVHKISLTTNGTIRFSDKALEVLTKNPKITITISNYPCATNNRKKLIEQLKHHHINFVLYEFMYENNEWFQSGDLSVERNDIDRDVQKIYDDCEQKECIVLANGQFATCGKIFTLCDIYGLNNESNHILNISEILKTEPDTLSERFSHVMGLSAVFKEACKYCKGTYTRVTPGTQLSREELTPYKKYRHGDFNRIKSK